ncbi:MAG: hypothetical protein JW795_19445 [Chitinivibrionales bacterium]|nr:hypothetical protein [Chitinivibrionales bacterium]
MCIKTGFRLKVIPMLVFMIGIGLVLSIQAFAPSRSCEQGSAVTVNVQVTVDDNVIALDYLLPPLEIARNDEKLYDGEPTTNLYFNGCITLRSEGEPVFPYIPSQVILPPGHTIDKITFHGGQLQTIEGSHIVEYGEAFHPISMPQLARPASVNRNRYKSAQPLPAQNAELVTIQQCRGVTIAYINICPVVFIPQTRSLSYYTQLSVTVTTKPDCRSGSGVRVRLDGLIDPAQRAENPEMVKRYVNGSIRGSYETGAVSHGEQYSLVIISNKNIIDNTTNPSINDFVKQKESKGWRVKVVDIAQAYSNYSGSDPEKLRKFIKTAYNDWKTEAVFLLGDISVIPLKTVYDKAQTNYEDNLPTDIPYQCLDNDTWQDDYKAELIIGRGSAENPKEAANILRKIIAYENDVSTESYLKRAIMVGEDLGSTFNPRYAKAVLNQLITGVTSAGTKGFNENPEFKVDGLHDTAGYTWNAKLCLDKFNSNTYSIIHHYGHCQYNYLMKMTHIEDPHASAQLKLDPNNNITNTKYSFIYSYGCIPGAFDKKCMAEAFTTTGPNGCWGVVLNSRYGWGGSLESPSHMYGRKFWDAFFGKGKTLVGQLNQYAHEENIAKIKQSCMRWCFLESNTLTDPTVVMRGGKETTKIHAASATKGIRQITVTQRAHELRLEAYVEKGDYSVSIFDTRGRRVALISSGTAQCSGLQQFVWNPSSVHSPMIAAGIIIVRLETASQEFSTPLIHF